jgi:hypothetical protein
MEDKVDIGVSPLVEAVAPPQEPASSSDFGSL